MQYKGKTLTVDVKGVFIFASSYNSTKCPLIVHQYFAASLWFVGERQEVKLSARAEVVDSSQGFIEIW